MTKRYISFQVQDRQGNKRMLRLTEAQAVELARKLLEIAAAKLAN